VKLTNNLHQNAEFKNVCSYLSTPPYVFLAWCLVKHGDNFTFTLLPAQCCHDGVTSETVNALRHFDRTPSTGCRPISGPLNTQNKADTHPCLDRDSNPRSQCSNGTRPYRVTASVATRLKLHSMGEICTVKQNNISIMDHRLLS
jgi:hypothetical protein